MLFTFVGHLDSPINKWAAVKYLIIPIIFIIIRLLEQHLVIVELILCTRTSLDKLNQLESQFAPLLCSVGFRRSVLIINHNPVCTSQRELGTIKHSLRVSCITLDTTDVLHIPSWVIIQVNTLLQYFYNRLDVVIA